MKKLSVLLTQDELDLIFSVIDPLTYQGDNKTQQRARNLDTRLKQTIARQSKPSWFSQEENSKEVSEHAKQQASEVFPRIMAGAMHLQEQLIHEHELVVTPQHACSILSWFLSEAIDDLVEAFEEGNFDFNQPPVKLWKFAGKAREDSYK